MQRPEIGMIESKMAKCCTYNEERKIGGIEG
jgi:hypothetical protein